MKAAATRFASPFGTLELRRYPHRSPEPLQAWNAADGLLLEVARQSSLSSADTLVVNDSQGALCTALSPRALWTDSALSVAALRQNETANNRPTTPVIWSTEQPPGAPATLLRIPRQTAYLEYQLATLASTMPSGSTLHAAGMDKHLSPRTAELLEHYIGPTQRHRGRHKARLFSAQRQQGLAPDAPRPAIYNCDELGTPLIGLANVFSRDSLDIGTRLLLPLLGKLPQVEQLVDLGCGNGVLGLAAYKAGRAEKVVFADESAQAIASARHNCAAAFPHSKDNFSFHHGDGLLGLPHPVGELILCNPPFHMEAHVDEFAGRHLLGQCAKHLPPQGQLCLVANRHLHYQAMLQRVFKRSEQIGGDRKFNVYLCTQG